MTAISRIDDAITALGALCDEASNANNAAEEWILITAMELLQAKRKAIAGAVKPNSDGSMWVTLRQTFDLSNHITEPADWLYFNSAKEAEDWIAAFKSVPPAVRNQMITSKLTEYKPCLPKF